MTRSALPQDYLPKQTLYEGFETIGDWTTTTGTAAASTDYVLQGSHTLKVTAVSGTPARTYKSIDAMPLQKFMLLKFYCDGVPANIIDPTSSIMLQFATATAFTTYASYTLPIAQIKQGWNYFYINPANFAFTGAVDRTTGYTYMRIRQQAKTGSAGATVYYDSLYTMEHKATPFCMIHFDNGLESVYTKAYPVLAALGITATVYVNSDFVGESGYMTLAQLQELYAAGWDIGNHTIDHTDLTTLTTEAEVIAKLQPCTDYLIENGLPRGAYHVAYPGTTSPNDVTLAALESMGMLTGRDAANSLYYDCNYSPYQLNNHFIQSTTTPAAVIAYAETAQKTGTGVCILFHDIVDEGASGTNKYNLADFIIVINGIVATKLKFKTINEWYEGLTNPRYRSLPLVRASVS